MTRLTRLETDDPRNERAIIGTADVDLVCLFYISTSSELSNISQKSRVLVWKHFRKVRISNNFVTIMLQLLHLKVSYCDTVTFETSCSPPQVNKQRGEEIYGIIICLQLEG